MSKLKTLYYDNGRERREIARCDEQSVMSEINKFLDSHSYKSHYFREWKDEQGRTWYDVGSWSEFFVLE